MIGKQRWFHSDNPLNKQEQKNRMLTKFLFLIPSKFLGPGEVYRRSSKKNHPDLCITSQKGYIQGIHTHCHDRLTSTKQFLEMKNYFRNHFTETSERSHTYVTILRSKPCHKLTRKSKPCITPSQVRDILDSKI
jgi:hypothetical protein